MEAALYSISATFCIIVAIFEAVSIGAVLFGKKSDSLLAYHQHILGDALYSTFRKVCAILLLSVSIILIWAFFPSSSTVDILFFGFVSLVDAVLVIVLIQMIHPKNEDVNADEDDDDILDPPTRKSNHASDEATPQPASPSIAESYSPKRRPTNKKYRLGKPCKKVFMDHGEGVYRYMHIKQILKNAPFPKDDIGMATDIVNHIVCMPVQSYPFFYSFYTELDSIAFLTSYLSALMSYMYEGLFSQEEITEVIGENVEHDPLDTSKLIDCVVYCVEKYYNMMPRETAFLRNAINLFERSPGTIKNQFSGMRNAFARKLIIDSEFSSYHDLTVPALYCAEIIISSIGVGESFRRDIKKYVLNAIDAFAYDLENKQSSNSI